jgi:hypothetical protein
MPNNTLDRAIEAVPKFEERIWRRFPKKLRLAQYADSSIYNYRLKIAQAVLYLKLLLRRKYNALLHILRSCFTWIRSLCR